MQYLYFVISELAHMNDMKLIAEGIENRSQLEMVKNNGADYIQGYYYSKPLSEDQLADCLVRFQQPDPALVTEESSPVNLEQWLNCSNAYAATPKLFQLLNQCIEILFAEQDLKTLLEKMLEILGRHFSVSRSFTCLGDFNGQPAIFEWCDRGLDSSLASRDRVIEGKIAHYLHKAFEQNGFLMSSDVSRLKPEFYDLLQADGVKSVLILPMPNEDQIVGYVGFHDLNYREWNSSEIVMLWNLARILGTSLEQIKLKKDAINKKRLLSNVLNTSGFNVMVCDID